MKAPDFSDHDIQEMILQIFYNVRPYCGQESRNAAITVTSDKNPVSLSNSFQVLALKE